MLGLPLLLLFNLLGILLRRYAHIPLPGNVLGMLLLLAALTSGIVKLRWLECTADFLLRHMLLFFAPVIVGILPLWPALQPSLAPAAASLILSTLATLTATAWTARALSPPHATKETTHA